MAKFRSLPIEVDAVRYTPYDYHKVLSFIREFHPEAKMSGSAIRINPEVGSFHLDPIDESFTIPTMEGDMKLRPGDYLIRGTIGEFYPCKREVFEKKYVEPVLDGSDTDLDDMDDEEDDRENRDEEN